MLTAIVSNSAGLLTLVGDPATFLVGSSIGMSFGTYLRPVSLGGVVSLPVLLPMLPVLIREAVVRRAGPRRPRAHARAVPVRRHGPVLRRLPPATIPAFVAMMFGATLGGNATLIGASASIVTAGICARNGQPLTFVGWLRCGLPLTVCQLVVSALYVLVLFRFAR